MPGVFLHLWDREDIRFCAIELQPIFDDDTFNDAGYQMELWQEHLGREVGLVKVVRSVKPLW